MTPLGWTGGCERGWLGGTGTRGGRVDRAFDADTMGGRGVAVTVDRQARTAQVALAVDILVSDDRDMFDTGIIL